MSAPPAVRAAAGAALASSLSSCLGATEEEPPAAESSLFGDGEGGRSTVEALEERLPETADEELLELAELRDPTDDQVRETNVNSTLDAALELALVLGIALLLALLLSPLLRFGARRLAVGGAVVVVALAALGFWWLS